MAISSSQKGCRIKNNSSTMGPTIMALPGYCIMSNHESEGNVLGVRF